MIAASLDSNKVESFVSKVAWKAWSMAAISLRGVEARSGESRFMLESSIVEALLLVEVRALDFGREERSGDDVERWSLELFLEGEVAICILGAIVSASYSPLQ